MSTTNLSKLNPWWLRLLLLMVIGSPIVAGWPHSFETTNSFADLSLSTAYAVLIWLFIYLSVGGEKLLVYLQPAVVLALTTTLIGSFLREVVPTLFKGSHGSALMLAKLFVTMLTVIPYGVFCINCFSARGLLLASTAKAARGNGAALHAAVALRIFQHVGETFIGLLDVWLEEHPGRFWPRLRTDWSKSKLGTLNVVTWVGHAIVTWSVALFAHSVAAIPPVVDEMARFRQADETTHEQ